MVFPQRCFDFLNMFLADWLSVFSRGTVSYVLSVYDRKSCILLMVLLFFFENKIGLLKGVMPISLFLFIKGLITQKITGT